MMKKTDKIRAQRGAVMIEMALVSLFVLIPLLFGIIEFSLILYNQAMITNASREGARAGIVYDEPRLTEAGITTVVNNYLQNHLLTWPEGSATPVTDAVPDACPVGTASGTSITVTVTYQYGFLVLPSFLGGLVGLNDLSATTVMRCE
jgi:Flp pilus assembly protein TadG